MFYALAAKLTELWGPFRLLGSHLLLLGIGTVLSGLTVWFLLPRLWHLLPRDRGRAFTPSGEKAKGKPTGAGVVIVILMVPVWFLVVPWSWAVWQIIGCCFLAMLWGYLDDRSATPWGELLKGSLDLLVAVLAALAICQGKPIDVWLPLVKGSIELSPWLYVPLASVMLWIMMNATNCSDGVDGLAGSLTSISIFYLGGFLYGVIGHFEVADYLLVPHNPEGARWAIFLFTVAGGLAGYLWHNASPSRVLMGDAGSRFLGLVVGVAVLVTGNPLLILVVAPVALANGGTGLVKVALLRIFRKLGFDVSAPTVPVGDDATAATNESQSWIHLLHKVRFPLHDHCRKILGWSDAQVLLRFLLIQGFLTPLLLALLVKVR